MAPKEIIISITNRCNLRCRMCDIPLKESKELPVEVWKQVIEGAYKLGVNIIVFSGGEPLVRKDIFELISYAKYKNIGVCITSNGTLIDDRVAKEIKKRGVNVVNISVEGNEEIHDYLRGQGSFRKALSALDNLRKYGVEVTIATMVSGYNYSHLSYVAKLAKEYGATTVKLQPFSDIFISSGKERGSFFIQTKDSDYLLYNIREFTSLCSRYGIVTNPLNYLEKMYSYLLSCRLDKRNGCDALLYSCPINSQGDVYPCWMLTDKNHVIGNIQQDNLMDIWNSQKRKDIVTKIIKEGCPGCVMSCYDKIFDKEELTNRIGASRERKINEHLRFMLKRLIRRWRFYVSYRGFPKDIIRRAAGFIYNKNEPIDIEIDIDKKDKEAIIDEIRKAKLLIEKELFQ